MKRFIEIGYAFGLCWYLLSQTANANPCIHPQRLVNGHIVNLQPLMEWWKEPKGVRPLAGWKHVQGSITNATALGWILTGKVGSKNRPATFLLKNPPREQLVRFQQLKRQFRECEDRRQATAQFLERPVYTDLYSLAATGSPAQPITLPEYREASSRLAELNHALNAIRAELAPMQDHSGNFQLDAFALNLHQSYQGLEVFNYGNLPDPRASPQP